MRPDRTVVASARAIDQLLEPKYTEPVTDSVEPTWQEAWCRLPVVFLLSPGADPTLGIDEIAKRKSNFLMDMVLTGEGEEVAARERIKSGFLLGSWVALQNCHLGLNFMNEIEELLLRVTDINKASPGRNGSCHVSKLQHVVPAQSPNVSPRPWSGAVDKAAPSLLALRSRPASL